MKNLVLFFFASMAFFACHDTKNGGLNDFKEVKIEDLTSANAPEGLEQHDNMWPAVCV